jgi:hypothetical protein
VSSSDLSLLLSISISFLFRMLNRMTNKRSNILFLRSFYTLLRNAIIRLSNIRMFIFATLHHFTEFLDVLDGYTLPMLRLFHCYLPPLTPLSSFLNRNPHLKSLALSPDPDSLPMTTAPFEFSFGMPSLVEFSGSSVYAPTILQKATSLQRISITWDIHDDGRDLHEEAVINALAKSNVREISFRLCRGLEWAVMMLELISLRLPQTKVLGFTSAMPRVHAGTSIDVRATLLLVNPF